MQSGTRQAQWSRISCSWIPPGPQYPGQGWKSFFLEPSLGGPREAYHGCISRIPQLNGLPYPNPSMSHCPAGLEWSFLVPWVRQPFSSPGISVEQEWSLDPSSRAESLSATPSFLLPQATRKQMGGDSCSSLYKAPLLLPPVPDSRVGSSAGNLSS